MQTTRDKSTGRPWIAVVILIAACIGSYFNSFAGVFLFDDERHILSQESIRHFWSIADVLSATRRPIVNMTLAFNYAAGELDVWGYHALNFAVHLLATLTLFGLVRRTLMHAGPGRRSDRRITLLATATALLWTVHPLGTQSVTYIIQRGESLMGLFFLLTLYCVVRGAGSALAKPWYVAAVAACALGMGSKAVMVTAPLVVLLYDRSFLGVSIAEAFRRRWSLYVGLAATWSVLLAWGVVRGVMATDSSFPVTVGLGVKDVTPIEYALTQPGVILHYLYLSLWPGPLCLDHDWPLAATAGGVVGPAVLIGLLVLLTAWSLWRSPRLGFVLAAFFLVLAPTSSVIPISDPIFEHRMYLPLAAVLVTVVLMAERVTEIAVARGLIGFGTARAGLVALGSVAVIGLTLGTVSRNRDYHNAESMWRDVLEKYPEKARPHLNLGHALYAEGRTQESIEQFRAAISIDPSYAKAHYKLGLALANVGEHDAALLEYEEALRFYPGYVSAHVNLGVALAKKGEFDRAHWHYARVLSLDPSHSGVRYNAANAYRKQERFDEAIAEYRKLLTLDPSHYRARSNLGYSLYQLGKHDQAAAELHKALELQPGNAAIQRMLDRVLDAQGGESGDP